MLWGKQKEAFSRHPHCRMQRNFSFPPPTQKVLFKTIVLHLLDGLFWILQKRHDRTLFYHALVFLSGPLFFEKFSLRKKFAFASQAKFGQIDQTCLNDHFYPHKGLRTVWSLYKLNKEVLSCIRFWLWSDCLPTFFQQMKDVNRANFINKENLCLSISLQQIYFIIILRCSDIVFWYVFFVSISWKSVKLYSFSLCATQEKSPNSHMKNTRNNNLIINSCR